MTELAKHMKDPHKMSPEELDGAWEQQLAARTTLTEDYDGDFAGYAASLLGLHDAFYRNSDGQLVLLDHGVKCIDEGTPGGVRIAGAGILEGIDQTVTMLETLDLDVIHCHDDCGAARLYAQLHNIVDVHPDELAKQFTIEIARRLGIQHHHIRKEQLRRPPIHVATVVYYSGVKAFDPAQLPDALPQGFVITRALHHSPQSAQTEADVACQIAFGSHGFGNRFDGKNPLIIVPVGNPHRPRLSLEALSAELQPVVSTYEDRVRISGFESPF